MYIYAEYYGEAGEYDVWFDLLRFVADDIGELIDEVEETLFGPYSLQLQPALYTQGRSYVLRKVPLSKPGVYELRLRIGGVAEPLIAERFIVEG